MVGTTGHDTEDGTVICGHGCKAKEYPRPVAIQEYSKNYCGVDKSDELRSYYGICLKAVKWWKYLFFFCIGVVNAFILYTSRTEVQFKAHSPNP